MRLSEFVFLLLLFGLSLAIRWQGFQISDQGSHYWLNAHSLTTFEIWETEGFSTYKGNLILTYPGKHNQFIRIPDFSGFFDDQGQLYYASYPPLGLWLPYGALSLLCQSTGRIGLLVFNLSLHFLCCLFLFFSLKRLKVQAWNLWLLVSLFLFSPGPMWFHANVYFSEMLAQLWWFILLWAFIRQGTEHLKLPSALAWGLLSFVFVLTEWLGVLAIATLGLIWLWQKRPWWQLVPLFVGGSLAILLCLWQYSQIAGWEALIEQLQERYAFRSGESLSWGLFMQEGILKNALRGYAFLPLLGITGLVISILKKHFTLPPAWLFLALVPVLLHAFLLRNFTYMHDFSALKSGPVWILLLAWTIQQFPFKWTFPRRILGIGLGLAMMLIGGMRYYYYAEAPIPDSEIGRQIKAMAPDALPVFVDFEVSLPMNFHAKRNIGYADSLGVQLWLQKRGLSKAILFHVVDDSVQSWQKIVSTDIPNSTP